jgi:hypothetical protein
MTSQSQDFAYCSDLSLQAGEPLYGSASQAQAYLLLEYSGAWGEKALKESDIPESVKARLNELGAAVKGLKTLLIKTQPAQRHEAEIRFFVAALSAQPARLYAFRFSDYLDLLSLDIPAILSGEAAYDPYLHKTALYLVCGNGRRDRCCARHGVPVFNALTAAMHSASEPSVWQCSHVGGHRFAANLLCLPHGLMYGRVRTESAPAIIDADRNGQIYLPNLRGRVCDRPVVQVTEYLLRQQRAEYRIDDIRPLEANELEPGEWLVRFAIQREDKIAQVRVRVSSGDERVFESCSFEKSTPILRYEVLSIER